MLTIPLASVPDLARDLASLLATKVVLDTGNAYEKRDGEAARQAEIQLGQILCGVPIYVEFRTLRPANKGSRA